MASGEDLAQACQAGLDIRLGRLRHHRLYRLYEEAARLHRHAERHPAALWFERLDLDAGLDRYATRLRFEHDSTGWLIHRDLEVSHDLLAEKSALDDGLRTDPDGARRRQLGAKDARLPARQVLEVRQEGEDLISGKRNLRAPLRLLHACALMRASAIALVGAISAPKTRTIRLASCQPTSFEDAPSTI